MDANESLVLKRVPSPAIQWVVVIMCLTLFHCMRDLHQTLHHVAECTSLTPKNLVLYTVIYTHLYTNISECVYVYYLYI